MNETTHRLFRFGVASGVFVIAMTLGIMPGAGGEPAGAPTSSPSTRPATTQPTRQPVPSRPTVSPDDLSIVMDYARRSFRAKVLDLPELSAKFRPMALADLRGIVHLTLRKNGGMLAESESGELAIVDAAVAAGAMLGRTVRDQKLDIKSGGDDLGLELEWLGPREYLTIPAFESGETWSDDLLHSFEPGVEGIGVEFRGKRGWSRPSLVFTKSYSADLMIASAERQIDLRNIQKLRFSQQIRYFRFWSYLLWQPTPTARTVSLCRGDLLVQPDEVTAAGLTASIHRIGDYLLYRQNENGEFSHEFVGSKGIYGGGNSARIQLRALDGLAALYGVRHRDEVAARLRLGIEAFRKHLEPLVVAEKNADGTESPRQIGLALAPVGHTGVLELSSRLLGAIGALGKGSPFEKERVGLIDGLISSQSETGFIAMAFDQPESQQGEVKLNDADCCLAIFALARAREAGGDARIREAVDKAVRYYEGRSVDSIEPGAASVLVRALCLHYAESNDARVSDLAFTLADRFASLQLNERNYGYPELWGAINVSRPGEVGADSALYLSALCDALKLARRIGDRSRSAAYESAVRAGARFVLQLEFRENGCYFIRIERDALGGIRSAPWSSQLRIDWTALGLEALIDARSVLFGESR